MASRQLPFCGQIYLYDNPLLKRTLIKDLLSSHVWRQDQTGFSHQDPGFIDHVINKKAEVVRVYLPPDANCLLSVTDRCPRSRNYVNVVVDGKQPAPQGWMTRSGVARPALASGNGRAMTATVCRT